MKTKLKFLSREDKYIGDTITVKYICVIDKSVFSNIPVNIRAKLYDKYCLLRDTQITFTAIGRAICHKTDTFDKTKGWRIAESKAKIVAYKKLYRICDDIEKYHYYSYIETRNIGAKNFSCYLKEINHIEKLIKNG